MAERDGTTGGEAQSRLTRALWEVAGHAVVLDERLRVVDYTPGLQRELGPLERGVPAAAQLCGSGDQRPIAEALSQGEAVSAELVRPAPGGGDRVWHVRASPLTDDDGVRIGWLLLLQSDPWQSGSPDAPVEVHGILTRDPKMKSLLRELERVARSDASVLVRGETGSGKELVARAIHRASRRGRGPFIALNCAALPASLLESELFGHVRGAFTGAVRDNPGHFRLADGGTLFLDEIAELPLELQAKLLRVLQERTVIPVGGSEPLPVDVRFVSATHRSLRRAVEAARFRADLMYRIRVIPVFIPALRERPRDIALLAQHFVDQHNKQRLRKVVHISPGAVRAMEQYPWPGNVRELMNAIEYAFAVGQGPVLTEAELPPEVREVATQPPPTDDAPPIPSRVNVPAVVDDSLPDEAQRLLRALERAGGHRRRAAESLGISRTTLWRKLREYGLEDA